MNRFVLKWIAIITMVIDHMGAILFPTETIFRIIGRIAFPIFIFMLIEGFTYTRNVKKYMMRLGVFALISEIPYDIAFYESRFHSNVIHDLGIGFRDLGYLKELIFERFMDNQNIFFTLLLGLVTIYLMNVVEKKYKNEMVIINIINAVITIAACFLSIILHLDYSVGGILFIVAFYLFRGNKFLIGLCLLIITGMLFRDRTGNMTVQAYDIFAMIPIALYNGQKGRDIKYFFYAFYPAHLIVLWLISFAI